VSSALQKEGTQLLKIHRVMRTWRRDRKKIVGWVPRFGVVYIMLNRVRTAKAAGGLQSRESVVEELQVDRINDQEKFRITNVKQSKD